MFKLQWIALMMFTNWQLVFLLWNTGWSPLMMTAMSYKLCFSIYITVMLAHGWAVASVEKRTWQGGGSLANRVGLEEVLKYGGWTRVPLPNSYSVSSAWAQSSLPPQNGDLYGAGVFFFFKAATDNSGPLMLNWLLPSERENNSVQVSFPLQEMIWRWLW